MNTDIVCCLYTEISIPQKEKSNQPKKYKHRNNYTKFKNILLRENTTIKNLEEQGLVVILLCTDQHMYFCFSYVNIPILFCICYVCTKVLDI